MPVTYLDNLKQCVLLLGVAVLLSFASPGGAVAHDPQLKQAEALLDDGEREQAIDALTKVIRQNPQEARAYYLRASIRQPQRRQGAGHRRLLSEAVRLDPKGLHNYPDRLGLWPYAHLDRAIDRLTDAMDLEPKREVV